jgi:hypothetical protein
VEEIVALILQLVIEVGLQLFGSIGFDFATESRRARGSDGTRNPDGCGWMLAFAAFGAICGGISLIFAPDLILPTLRLRIANLIVAPLLAGALSALVAAQIWAARGASPKHHFWRGFWFALLFGLTRFAYAHR